MIVTRGDGPHLQDPNWYRVRYALAVQCLEIATATDPVNATSSRRISWRFRRRGEQRTDKAGWPIGIDSSTDGKWRKDYGVETADRLADLYKNRAPGEQHLTQGATAAKEEAEELVASTAGILEEAGWQWIGRKPPRFVRWKRALSPARITRRRPVYDRELVRFLSWVVEPASVVLLFSAWLVEEKSFPLEKLKEAIGPRSPDSFEPLDRRKRDEEGEGWLIAYLSRLVYDWPLDTARRARAQAVLGRTQLRRPRQPSFRVQYNLACLFSRLAHVAEETNDREGKSQFVSIAAGQLDKALFHLPDEQRARLVKWAKVDPGLATLREVREDEFAEIIARWGAGDTQEAILEDSTRIHRIKYDPGSAILDIFFLDGSRSQYGGVPQSAVDPLFAPVQDGDTADEQQVRQTREQAFLEMIKRDYPPIRP